MSLDKGMGYGAGQPDAPKKRFLYVALGVLGGLLVVLVGSMLLGGEPAATGRAPATPATTETPTSAAAPSPTVDHVHAEETGSAPQAAWTTLDLFMLGWTSTDKATRAALLAETATESLAAGLADTSPENVITQPRTRVEVVGASPYAAEFRVWFEQVEQPIRVVLVADPDAKHGWRVDRIEKRGD